MATVVKKFNYASAQQQFVVPPLVTSIFFELWGAPGSHYVVPFAGGTAGFSGTSGTYAFINQYDQATMANNFNVKSLVGYISATLAVSAGTQYFVYVGGAGGIPNCAQSANNSLINYGVGGFNGGSKGGYAVPNAFTAYAPGGGGGGGTDIRVGGVAVSNRILVAGGGGGGSWGSIATKPVVVANPTTPNPPYPNSDSPAFVDGHASYYQTTGGSFGGAGGGPVGQTGGLASSATAEIRSGTGGGGGSQSAGGAAGVGTGGAASGAPGTLGSGGNGAGATTAAFGSFGAVAGGGGGGGGYYGGGGGTSGLITPTGTFTGGGGGGGSNFASGSFTGVASYQHVMPGGAGVYTGINGFARMTYTQPPSAPTISAPTDGQYIDAGSPLVVEWTFFSLAPVGQAGFDIQYQPVGGGSFTVITNPTAGPGNSFAISAGTFAPGTDYNIQVRTYDTDGDVSPWTASVVVHAVSIPSPPVISSPATGFAVSTTTFNVTWTVDSGAVETMYQVRAYDENNVLVVDSGELHSSRVNYATNPNFETSTAGWTVSGCTIAQSTTHSFLGTHSGKISWGTGAAGVDTAKLAFPNTIAGQLYLASVYYTVDTVGTDPTADLVILDSDGVTPLPINGTSLMTPATAGTFVRGFVDFFGTGDTVYIAIQNAVGATSGQVGYVDALLIEEGILVSTYFDGGNANGLSGTVSWQGTANLSVSQLVVANVLTYSLTWPLPSQPITLSVRYADLADIGIYTVPGTSNPIVNLNPPDAPTVVLSIDNDTGAATLDITNTSGGGFPTVSNDVYRTDLTNSTPEVRIGTNIAPSGTFIDYTPGTQVVYAYRVRAYSAVGGFADAT